MTTTAPSSRPLPAEPHPTGRFMWHKVRRQLAALGQLAASHDLEPQLSVASPLVARAQKALDRFLQAPGTAAHADLQQIADQLGYRLVRVHVACGHVDSVPAPLRDEAARNRRTNLAARAAADAPVLLSAAV